uniref:Type II toxin-antitoxin system HicB family antitoxin n=1 Tax=Candidatus Kentrum sp. DK TaxID=2126562 RepID=A0A450T2A1_9GAMM|nr:MAG: hypothetical protein BECKDK2373C_GA0170839_105810 [Candidatus Kentron sp. DK]VFJ60402.1 MAG: hypothetical protein BECKDK2373B_GA0170837_10927 [Candidatus Kentron sp. DK]
MEETRLKYTYWQDGDMWIGYLDEYRDYMTQGETMDELRENLMDIYEELTGDHIPAVRHHAELLVA